MTLGKILECSSQGDRRFSALYAQVSVCAHTQSIETHYQLAKRFGTTAPRTPRDAKGRKPTHFQVQTVTFPLALGPAWYDLLWAKYLDQHPELVTYAQTFDDFHDRFHTPRQVVCQADSIRRYIHEGRTAILARTDVQALFDLFSRSVPEDHASE